MPFSSLFSLNMKPIVEQKFKNFFPAGGLWLMPIILATQEAEIRRIAVRSQPRQIVPQDPISENPSQKK
jgi:hypothetical protein